MSNENNNEIAIKQGDECVVLVKSFRGWGMGNTLAEALAKFKKGGNYTDKELINGLLNGEVGVYVANTDDLCIPQSGSPIPIEEGKTIVFLGNKYNNVRIYGKQ